MCAFARDAVREFKPTPWIRFIARNVAVRSLNRPNGGLNDDPEQKWSESAVIACDVIVPFLLTAALTASVQIAQPILPPFTITWIEV